MNEGRDWKVGAVPPRWTLRDIDHHALRADLTILREQSV
jgi:hypothetical protein